MKKTLLASAIAAATFSGGAMAQNPSLSASEAAAKIDSMPQVYGNIQYAIAHDNIDGGPSNLNHFDNGTTLGVKHDHEIARGITGFFKVELEGINADDKAESNGIESLDEAYIGVKGDSFGQVWVGSDDSTYETAIDKIVNFYEVATLNLGGSYETGEGDLVQYMSPSFGGLKLGAAVQINGDGDASNNDKSYPYQLAAIYSVDALELAVAMDSNDGGTEYSSNDASNNNENTYGVRATYGMGDLSLTGQYQTRKDVADVFGLQGVYTMGANQFSVAYEMETQDNPADTETTTVTLQALHNVSDHMYVYFEGYLGGGDEVYEYDSNDDGTIDAASDERTIAAVGAVYYF